MRILILEDDLAWRMPIFRRELIGHEVTHHDNAANLILALEEANNSGNDFDLVFLDHDLGGKPPDYYGQFTDPAGTNTGSEVVRWIVANQIKKWPVIIHSINSVEGPNMRTNLQNAGFEAHYIPFGELRKRFLDPNFLQHET